MSKQRLKLKSKPKAKSKRSYSKLIAHKQSWRPLMFLSVVIGLSVAALSVYASSGSIGKLIPIRKCTYANDGQTANCSTSTNTNNYIPSQSPITNTNQTHQSSKAVDQIEPDTLAEDFNFKNINLQRSEKQLGTILRSPCLDNIARNWAMRMATSNVLAHGDGVEIAKTACGKDVWQSIGENVGLSSGYTNTDINNMFNNFMNSPTHRDNILNNRYNVVGIGAYHIVNGNLYLNQIFMSCKDNTCNPSVANNSF